MDLAVVAIIFTVGLVKSLWPGLFKIFKHCLPNLYSTVYIDNWWGYLPTEDVHDALPWMFTGVQYIRDKCPVSQEVQFCPLCLLKSLI